MDIAQRQGTHLVFASSLLFSIGGLCVKLIPWSALAINGARNFIAVAVVAVYLLATRHRLRWNLPVALGALSMMGVTTLFTMANKLTTAANTIVLQFTAPIFVILFSLVLLRKKPQRLDVIACVVVLSGVVLFFIDGLQSGNHLGNLLALLSGVCYAGVFMMNSSPRADALSSTFFGQLASGLLFAPLCLAETDFSPSTLLAVGILGVFQVGLAYILLSLGIGRTPPVTASLISGLEPVLNPIWVALFYGETVTPLALAGAAVVICGVVGYQVYPQMQTRRKRKKAS